MKIKIEFEIDIPELEHTEEELEAYLRFAYGDSGKLSGSNPFIDTPPDVIFETFEWENL